MKLEWIQNIILIIPVIISILTFFLVISIVQNYHPRAAIYKVFIKVNHTLQEKRSGIFNYERINDFLVANGAKLYWGNWIDPVKYEALRIAVASLFFLVGIKIHFIMALVFWLVGFMVPKIMLNYRNQQENNKMVKDLQLLYDALQVQIKSGVHISAALMEAYRNIRKGRLRTALEELSGELYVKNSLEEALNNFNRKFNSVFIDSLCLILHQAKESGLAVELLRDMAVQIEDMSSALQLKRKEQLNRITTMCMLGVLAAVLAVVIYACAMTMYRSVSGF